MQTLITYASPIFSIVGVVSAIILGWIAFRRSTKEDSESEGKNNGVILTELGYIKSGIDDVKRKQERQEELRVDDVKKIAEVEASAKQAHKRIDSLEERVNGMHQSHYHEQA